MAKMTAKIIMMSLDVLLTVQSAKSQNFSASLIFSVLMGVGFVMVNRTVKMDRMRKNVVSVVLVQLFVERGLKQYCT